MRRQKEEEEKEEEEEEEGEEEEAEIEEAEEDKGEKGEGDALETPQAGLAVGRASTVPVSSQNRDGEGQGLLSLGWGTCHSTHLGPLTRPLLGADSAALLGVKRPDEGTDGGAAHHVDGDPRLLHRLDHPDVGATPGWMEKIKRRIDEIRTPTPLGPILPRRGTHLAPPPPRTRAMVLPVRTRANREKSLCRSALFSNTFSYISRCGRDGQWVTMTVVDHQGHPEGHTYQFGGATAGEDAPGTLDVEVARAPAAHVEPFNGAGRAGTVFTV